MRKAVVILVVVAMACSGGGGGGSTSDTIDPKVVDQLYADAAVLQASDLPGSFASSSSSSQDAASSSLDAQASENADKCFGAAGLDITTFDNDRTAKAKRDFNTGSGLESVTVGGEIEMYRSAASLSAQLVAVNEPSVLECFRQVLVDDFTARGATVGDLSIVPTKVEGLGDEQTGFVVTGPVTVEGIDFVLGAELDYTRVGRVAVSASVFSLQGTPDHSLAVTAMQAMVRRLQQ